MSSLPAVAVHDAAAGGKMWAGWDSDWQDERQVWHAEGPAIGARSEDLARNNPVASAIVTYQLDSVLGQDGLRFRSSYQADPGGEVSDEDKRARDQITRFVRRAFAGTRFDVAGRRTTRDLLADLLWCALLPGNGIGYRVWRPDRPGGPVTGACMRVIHPKRVTNPNHQPNGPRLANGWELDRFGDPVAMQVKTHRHALGLGNDTWTRIPIWGTDGHRNVCHLTSGHHPDQIMGYGFLRSMATTLKIHDNVQKTYIVGKQIQASYPLIIETDDPATIKMAKQRKQFLGEDTRAWKLKPNAIYFVRRGTMHHFTDMKFNGADMAEFSDALIGVACAAVGLPRSVVMKQLGRASLAAARAELADAWRSTLVLRQRLIDYVVRPATSWVIAEGIARGAIEVDPSADTDQIYAGAFQGIAAPSPDRLKDVQAAATAVEKLKVSPTTGQRMIGLDYEEEVAQADADAELWRATFGATMAVQGASLPDGDADDEDPDEEDEDERDERDDEEGRSNAAA